MEPLKIISITLLILYFATLLFIVAREKKSNNVMDYFFAGRSLPFWALSITFIASWWGAASAMSTADLAFDEGVGSYWYYGAPVLLSTFILIFFSKFIRRVGFLTQGEMMEARYSKLVAKLLSLLIFLFMTITAASQMVGMGDLLGIFLGWDYEVSVLVGTLIVLVYSFFGGFRGVVLTDIIQFVLLLISLIAVFIVAYDNSGGWDSIADRAITLKKDNFTNILSGVDKYLVYIITFGCAWVIQANVWQRLSATRNSKDAKKMALMSFVIYIPLYLLVVLTGMAALVLYDTLPIGGVVPAIIVDYMHPIVGAITFIGISSAIMSTMDSLINTGAMTLALDLNMSNGNEQQQLRFSKIATIIVVVLGLVIALKVRSILLISWIASDIITTGLFVPLVAGFFWRRGTSKGAIASIVSGTIFSLWNLLVILGVNIPTFWRVESTEQVVIGITISIVIYVVVSLLSKPEYEKANRFIEKARGNI